MTNSEKYKLIEDLSHKLPYEVICQVMDGQNGFDKDILTQITKDGKCSVGYLHLTVINVRPYLRPISSMTEKERTERNLLLSHEAMLELGDAIIYSDYMDAHMFDIRGLIEKGLALEAPEDMYKII